MAKELSQEEEEKERDVYENKWFQCTLSPMETHWELFATDHNWQWGVKLERGVMVAIGPYSEILKERGNLHSQLCLLASKNT
jgi:hypothetical protein